MRIRKALRPLALATALLLLTACGRPAIPPPTETPTAAPTPLPTPTPTTPPREILLAAPEEGATVTNPVDVRGCVSVMPFEANLRGRAYDAQGQVVGEEPIQAKPDVEGDLGGPGTFAGSIPFQVKTAGPGEVEVAEISARDGSVVVSATVAVTLTIGATSLDLSEMDIREWTSTSPDGAWVARGLAAFAKSGAGQVQPRVNFSTVTFQRLYK